MIIKIPFFQKKIIIEVKFEESFDDIIVSLLMNSRWQREDDYWMPDKIKAIKFLRGINNTYGIGEAKDYVENLIKKNSIFPLTNDEWISYNSRELNKLSKYQ